MYRELLIGCGHSREKRMHVPDFYGEIYPRTWQNLTTLDNNPDCEPDVEYNLCHLNIQMDSRLPFDDNTFNELHAYEVLEHITPQGDYHSFFVQFGAFWRVLKPDGYLCATVPSWQSVWAWGDPGHTRIINDGSLVFLDPREYEKQLGKTAMSDYRKELGSTNFQIVSAKTRGQTFAFVLKAIK